MGKKLGERKEGEPGEASQSAQFFQRRIIRQARGELSLSPLARQKCNDTRPAGRWVGLDFMKIYRYTSRESRRSAKARRSKAEQRRSFSPRRRAKTSREVGFRRGRRLFRESWEQEGRKLPFEGRKKTR